MILNLLWPRFGPWNQEKNTTMSLGLPRPRGLGIGQTSSSFLDGRLEQYTRAQAEGLPTTVP